MNNPIVTNKRARRPEDASRWGQRLPSTARWCSTAHLRAVQVCVYWRVVVRALGRTNCCACECALAAVIARVLLVRAGCWSALRLRVLACGTMCCGPASRWCAAPPAPPLPPSSSASPVRVCPTHLPLFPFSFSLLAAAALCPLPRLRTLTTRPSCCLHSATPHTHTHTHPHS